MGANNGMNINGIIQDDGDDDDFEGAFYDHSGQDRPEHLSDRDDDVIEGELDDDAGDDDIDGEDDHDPGDDFEDDDDQEYDDDDGTEADDDGAEEEGSQDDEPDPIEQELNQLSPLARQHLINQISSDIEQKFNGRLRNIEGNLGGMRQKLDMMATAKAAAEESGADAPSAEQIANASTSGEAMQQLREDFPEFADALDEAVASMSPTGNNEYQQQLQAAEAKAASTAQEFSNFVTGFKAREKQRALSKHPDFDEVVRTREFFDWAQKQPPETLQKMDSMYADDAIEVLDSYKATLSKPQRRQRRLENSVPATKGRSQQRLRKTEDEEFESAYYAARGG